MKNNDGKNKKMGKRTKILIATGVVAASLVILATSTFLWFSSTASEENVLEMDTFLVKITENFDPNTPVQPGAEITKEIGVENQSTVPVAVRMKLEETLQLLKMDDEGNPDVDFKDTPTPTDGEIIVTVSQHQVDALIASGYTEDAAAMAAVNIADCRILSRKTDRADGTGQDTQYFAYLTPNMRLMEYNPATQACRYAIFMQDTLATTINHGMGTSTDTIDHKAIVLNMKTGTDAEWVLDPESGWYYYNKLLPAGQVSGLIVDSVSFSPDLPNTYKGAVYTLT